MICIYCSGVTKVTNSRTQKRQNQTWRRRKCTDCEAVITSTEAVALDKSVVVVDRTNKIEPFLRDKLMLSVYESLKHRKTATIDASELTSTIICRLLPKIESGTIKREDILETSKDILNRFDTVAATHYSAFHSLA